MNKTEKKQIIKRLTQVLSQLPYTSDEGIDYHAESRSWKYYIYISGNTVEIKKRWKNHYTFSIDDGFSTNEEYSSVEDAKVRALVLDGVKTIYYMQENDEEIPTDLRAEMTCLGLFERISSVEKLYKWIEDNRWKTSLLDIL